MADMEFSIYRFDPDKDSKPTMQDFTISRADCKGAMLLDALEAIKGKYDESLSFRRSCGEGVCGSDGMNINGKNALACITQLNELPRRTMIRPLPGFPVVRDLIVDMTQFYRQYEKAEPYLQNDTPAPTTERLQTIDQRAEMDGLYECILCACCTSSCPSYWWNPDKFMGPAALLWACRFICDSRDTNRQQRLQMLQDAFSLFRCRSIMNCVDVCPKGLNPAEAIGRIRRKMLQDSA